MDVVVVVVVIVVVAPSSTGLRRVGYWGLEQAWDNPLFLLIDLLASRSEACIGLDTTVSQEYPGGHLTGQASEEQVLFQGRCSSTSLSVWGWGHSTTDVL